MEHHLKFSVSIFINVLGCARAILFHFMTSNFMHRWYTTCLYRTECIAELSYMRTMYPSIMLLQLLWLLFVVLVMCHCPSSVTVMCKLVVCPLHFLGLCSWIYFMCTWLAESMHNWRNWENVNIIQRIKKWKVSLLYCVLFQFSTIVCPQKEVPWLAEPMPCPVPNYCTLSSGPCLLTQSAFHKGGLSLPACVWTE